MNELDKNICRDSMLSFHPDSESNYSIMQNYDQARNLMVSQLFVLNDKNTSNKNSIDSNNESNILTPSFTQEMSASGRTPYRYPMSSNKQMRGVGFK